MKAKHLSVWGVGPVYALLTAAVTVLGLLTAHSGMLQAGNLPELRWPMGLAGGAMLLLAAALFLGAHWQARLFQHVRRNELVTSGVYAWVRNPVYSAALFAASSVLLMAHNWLLLPLPLLLWAAMKPMLAPTEEKWLLALYGAEYAAYCAKVNRALPWPPRRAGSADA